MSTQPQYTTVQTKDIYHGLPVFPDSIKGLSAIITGANGMSGHHMIRVLEESPERWTSIFALSRRPPILEKKWDTNVQHIPLDFLADSPEDLAKAMRESGVKADYVFFFSYVQTPPKEGGEIWSDAESMVKINAALLRNFLGALKLAEIKPKRVLLQTGAKNYGSHLGPINNPAWESDPRVTIEPNFYYAQEDILFEYSKETGVEWNVVRPSYVLGAVREAYMNLAYPLGIVGAVQAHLGQPMVFPGDFDAFHMVLDMSSAMMDSYLEEWAVLTPQAANQAFNACDGSQFSFGKFWPILAKWFGAEYELPAENAQYFPFRFTCPTPRGFGPQTVHQIRYSFVEWAGRPEVQTAWKELVEKHGLTSDPISDIKDRARIFRFADGAVLAAKTAQFSMDKARKLGFFGTTDSIESFRKVMEELADLKMLPPLQKA